MNLPPFSKMQDRMVDFALDREGCAWFAPPGMGKTRADLEVINESQGRVLVLAPKLVCMSTWPAENKKWGYNFPMRFLHGGQRNLRGHEKVSLVNYDAIPWLVSELEGMRNIPYETVIFDELSKMKNPETKRFKDWLKVAGRFKYRIGQTGTPVGAHLKDLFGEMFVCDLGRSLGTDHQRFLRHHFFKSEYTYQLEPYHDTEATLLAAMRDRAISFDINDLDMPDISHNPIYLELPQAVTEYYEELHADSLIEDLDVYAMNAAVRSGKKRQLASGTVINDRKEKVYLHDAKAERLVQIVDELQGQPVMIFFEFIHDYEAICRALGPVPALYGGTKPREAVGIIDRWNAGKLPYVALHPRSAAYGVNMQDSGHHVVFYTCPWSLEMVIQGIGRVWRQGQKEKVIVHYLLISDTEDARVYDRLLNRQDVHARIMQGLL